MFSHSGKPTDIIITTANDAPRSKHHLSTSGAVNRTHITVRHCNRRRRRQRVVVEDRSVTPVWLRVVDLLHRSAGGVLLLSLRSWSIHRLLGRPGRHFQLWNCNTFDDLVYTPYSTALAYCRQCSRSALWCALRSLMTNETKAVT